MKSLLTILFLLIAHSLLAQSPLTTYLESVRQGSYASVPSAVLNDTARASELLQTLSAYQNDTLTVVRSRAYNIVQRIGLRSNDPAVRQAATDQLAQGIADADAGVSGNASQALTYFRRADFTPATQARLVDRLQISTPHLDQVARLVGFVQPLGSEAALQRLLAEKVNPSTRWAIRLALARLGDATATDYILNKLAAAPVNDALVYDIVPGLVYTRQPAVFDYLKTLIMSDERRCQSADPDSGQNIRCGYRVMEAVAPALKGFPIAVDAYGELLTDDYEQALQQVRAWWNEQQGYPMKMDQY